MAKVLYVEDNRDWQKTVKGLLEDEGHTVVTFSTADETMNWLADGNKPNLIICDANLTDADDAAGIELANWLYSKYDYKVVVFGSDRVNLKKEIQYIGKDSFEDVLKLV